jgi:hypothetical protein
MSTLFGGAQKTTTTSKPWDPQAQQLQHIFDSAQSIFDSKVGTPWYEGPLSARLDPLTEQGIGAIGDYVGGTGAEYAGAMGGSANDLLSGSAAQFLKSIGAFGDMASADPTQANINAAGAYADNPYLQGQIDAVGRDIRRNLTENVMPSIDRAATATGNINSSRAGVAEGIAARGAEEAMADAAANMRGDAWARGLGLAESARGTNLGAMGMIPGMYGSGIGMGYEGLMGSNAMTMGNLNAMIQAGQIKEQDLQDYYDSELARWMGNDTRDMNLLNQYYGIVGSNNWGGTQTQKTSGGGPGLLGGLLGAGMAAGAMFGTGGAFPGAFGLFKPGG